MGRENKKVAEKTEYWKKYKMQETTQRAKQQKNPQPRGEQPLRPETHRETKKDSNEYIRVMDTTGARTQRQSLPPLRQDPKAELVQQPDPRES